MRGKWHGGKRHQAQSWKRVSSSWWIKWKARHERKHNMGWGRGGRIRWPTFTRNAVVHRLCCWKAYGSGSPPCQLPCSNVPQSNCARSREEEMHQIRIQTKKKSLHSSCGWSVKTNEFIDNNPSSLSVAWLAHSYSSSIPSPPELWTHCADLYDGTESPFPPPLLLSQMCS